MSPRFVSTGYRTSTHAQTHVVVRHQDSCRETWRLKPDNIGRASAHLRTSPTRRPWVADSGYDLPSQRPRTQPLPCDLLRRTVLTSTGNYGVESAGNAVGDTVRTQKHSRACGDSNVPQTRTRRRSRSETRGGCPPDVPCAWRPGAAARRSRGWGRRGCPEPVLENRSMDRAETSAVCSARPRGRGPSVR